MKKKKRKTKIRVDAILKQFLSLNERFADMMNAVAFHGNQVINEAMLSDYDSDVSTFYEKPILTTKNRNRDLIKKVCIGDCAGLIAIENQAQVKPDLPYRVKEYDCHTFLKQYHHCQSQNKLMPILQVMTLVIYYGDKKWKKPKTYEEVSFKPPEALREFMEFKMFPVVEIMDIDYHLFRNKDNRQLVQCLQILHQCKGNINVLQGMKVSKDVAYVLAAFMDDYQLLQFIKKQKEEVFMYQSLELFKANAVREGVKKGIEKGKRKEKVRILTLLLRNKLQFLSPEIVTKIKKSSTRKLEGLLKHLYEIESEKDILEYL